MTSINRARKNISKSNIVAFGTLSTVIFRYAEQADKLCNLDSTNSCENMNNLIARKAPKMLHFSGSESLNYRVAAAVAEKHCGYGYICEVSNEAVH